MQQQKAFLQRIFRLVVPPLAAYSATGYKMNLVVYVDVFQEMEVPLEDKFQIIIPEIEQNLP
jgi:hypothetical protein